MRTLRLKLTQQDVIKSFLDKSNAKIEEAEHYKIITYDTMIRGSFFPALACFSGRSAKAYCNFYYRTEERRGEVIENFKRNVLADQQRKEERRRERREFKTTCKVGDIFECSWGYEQTNIDYYKIIELKGNVGIFVEIGCKMVEDSLYSHGMACNVIPDPTEVKGEPFRKIIQLGEVISLESYKYCHKSDCKPTYKSWYY